MKVYLEGKDDDGIPFKDKLFKDNDNTPLSIKNLANDISQVNGKKEILHIDKLV